MWTPYPMTTFPSNRTPGSISQFRQSSTFRKSLSGVPFTFTLRPVLEDIDVRGPVFRQVPDVFPITLRDIPIKGQA